MNSVKVSPSVILFWLKTDLAVTNTRIAWRAPNTLLGMIPLGYQEDTIPLANTASVGVNVRFKLGRLIWGLLMLVAAFLVFPTSAWLLGVLFLIWAIASIANSFGASLDIRNNGGALQSVSVSVFEKSKLESFKNQVQQQLYTDHGHLRHQETMNVQQAQLYVQQSQLNAHLAANQQQPHQVPQQQVQPQTPPPLPPAQQQGGHQQPGTPPTPNNMPPLPPQQ